jgi:hypothetical protein
MSTNETCADVPTAGEPAGRASARNDFMPRPLKLAIAVTLTLAVSGAIFLFIARGDAFLINLSNMSGLHFCF